MKDETLYRYFRNEASQAEIQQIEEWLESDPSHQREFDAAHMLFNVMTLDHADDSTMLRGRTSGVFRRVIRVGLQTAAALAILVGAGYIGAGLMRKSYDMELTSSMNVLEVPAAQRLSITLADGTLVWLNGGSRLEYPAVFPDGERRVRLTGEAMFDVEHDTEHPFVVETFATEIEVLGTRFNVYADTEDQVFTATLVEGKIQARNLIDPTETPLELSPDEMVRLVDGSLHQSRTDAEEAITWTEGYISIGSVGFEELMRRFENAYGVDIVIDRETLPVIEYSSGKIRVSEGIEFALDLLRQACEFTYENNKETRTITIY